MTEAKYITYWEYMRKAEQTQETLDNIPIASLQTIVSTNQGTILNPKNIKAVVVNGRIVGSVSKRYRLVQHKDAFSPIFNGLHQTATPYEFSLFETDTKAMLNVFVDEIGENGSMIKLGFRAVNSINGETAIVYDIRADSITSTLEIVGYRQVCSNGMKIRVPLDRAEELRIEKVERVKELIKMATRIVHMGTEEAMKQKIEAVQYVTEAIALLKNPIARIIQKAKSERVGEQQAKELLKIYIGKRMNQRILEQFKKEEQTMWGIYNACTAVASHDCTIPTMNGLINSSARMLEQELFPKKD
jgi:cell fate (sporulation/competence/biofilm development) regulator YmcA (YheA/YmcA/DUF963 family)